MYQFGGIYLDTDSHSVKRFPKILQKSFVSYVFLVWNNICNCVFGFSKHSSFLKFVLESLKLNWKRPGYKDQWAPGKTGPTFLTSMLVSLYWVFPPRNKKKHIPKILARSFSFALFMLIMQFRLNTMMRK